MGTRESQASPQMPQTEKETRCDIEGSKLEGRRVVTSNITRNTEASQPTGEAKIVPKKEELTQVWPQQGLALHLKSPGNTKRLYQPPP